MVTHIKPPAKGGFFSIFGSSNTKSQDNPIKQRIAQSIESLKAQEESLHTRIAAREDELRKLTTQIKEQKDSYRTYEESLKRELPQLKDLKEDLNQKEKLLFAKEKELVKLEQQLRAQQEQDKRQQTVLAEKAVTLKQQKHNLECVAQDSEKQLTRLNLQLQATTKQLEQKKQELRNTTHQAEESTAIIEQRNTAQKELTKTLATQKQAADKLRHIQTNIERETATFTNSTNTAQKEIAKLEGQKTSLTKDIKLLEQTSIQRRETQQKLTDEITAQKKYLETINNTREEVIVLERERETLKKNIAADKNTINTTKTLLRTLQTQQHKAENALADIREKLNNLTTVHTDLTRIADEQKVAAVIAQKETEVAKAQLSASKEELAELTTIRNEIALRQKAFSITEKNLRVRELQLQKKEQEQKQAQQKLDALVPLEARISQEKEEKQRFSDEIKKMLNENTKTLATSREAEAKLRTQQTELLKQQRETTRRMEAAQQREAEINHKEKQWETTQAAIAKTKEELGKQAKNLQEDVKAKTEELAHLRTEWDSLMKLVQEARQELSEDKAVVERLVKNDIKLLVEKEQETVDLVKQIEADKTRIEKDQDAIVTQLQDLEHARAEHAKKSAELTTREKATKQQETLAQKMLAYAQKEQTHVDLQKKRLLEAKELRADTKKLDARYRMLVKLVATQEQKAHKLSMRNVEDQALLKREKQDIQKEKELSLRAQILGAQEKEMAQHRRHVAEEYIQERAGQEFTTRRDASEEIRTLLREARQEIDGGNIDRAARRVIELDTLAQQITDPTQKKLIGYDIKDLKTSIKLANLV